MNTQATSDDIILHNYPQSPVAEKVRVFLGMKKLSWYSVEIPRIPPKPLLVTLTGGYRRTPVMQIGADIFCDSQCIMQELEHRYPDPACDSGDLAGLMACLARWTDGALFDLAVKIVLGSAGDALPADFAEDRGRLYLGEQWADGLKQANQQLPHLLAQLRALLTWIEHQLSDQRLFLTGSAPAAIDARIYHVVWFVRGRWEGGPALLEEFPHLQLWENRIRELGHGSVSPLQAEQAIELALNAEPATRTMHDDRDPQGLCVDDRVLIEPDVDGGEEPVAGTVRAAGAQIVAIDCHSTDAGLVCVHFPRAGYRVTKVD